MDGLPGEGKIPLPGASDVVHLNESLERLSQMSWK